MNENDLIKVLQELKVYSQTWKTICTQNFSCQTDFQESDINNNIPFIYCSQYPIDGHVETQCNIPLSQVHCKKCENAFPVEDAATQCDFPLIRKECSKAEASQRYSRHIKREKDDDFLSVQDPYSLGLSESSHGTEKTLDYSTQQNLVVGPLKSEVDVSETSKITKAESKNVCIKKIFDPGSPRNEPDSCDQIESADYHQNEEAMDYDEPEDEPVSKGKILLTDSDKELFYSDDEKFWKEMTKKRKSIFMKIKQKKQKRKRRNITISSVKVNLLKKERRDYLSYKERTPYLPQVENDVDKLGNVNLQKVNSFTTADDGDRTSIESECDWLTDDESDEESEPNSVAFKGELFGNMGGASFLCDICGKRFAKSHILREHIVNGHNNHDLAKTFPHRCIHCKRIYSGAKQLKSHQYQYKGPCELCGFMFDCSGLFWTHRRKHNAVCKVCNKTFANMGAYRFHVKSFHEKSKVACNLCGRKFLYQSQLNVHMVKMHSDPTSFSQIYKCEECEFSTVSLKSLHIHKGRIHSRVYNCNICSETFNKQQHLKLHKKTHKSIFANVECKVCHKGFRSESELTEHCKVSHSVQDSNTEAVICESSVQISYPCFPCQEVFATADDQQTHILSVHDIPSNDTEESAKLFQETIYIGDGRDAVDASGLPINPNSTMSISLPASAVPPDVDMVEIDGIHYQVIRE